MRKAAINFIKTFVCIAITLLLLPLNSFNYVSAYRSDSDRIIVSMGDSYSAGEGIDNFYDYNLPIEDRVNSKDWLAHRSMNSWGGQLRLDGVSGSMASHRGTNWYFVAASGATTEHIEGEQTKPYKKESNGQTLEKKEDDADVPKLPPQISVFDTLDKKGKKADYVTLTFGGNDVGFADIITSAAVPPLAQGFANVNSLSDGLTMAWNKFYRETRTNLKKSYKLISERAGEQAYIIVAGYPRLISKAHIGNKQRFIITVSLDFDEDEAKLVNESVDRFNLEIENIVTACRAENMKICFVPVHEGEGSFEGHEAYTSDPYINAVSLEPKEQDLDKDAEMSAYSIHPNKKGAEVYRKFVQAKIDDIEKNGRDKTMPARTTSDERDIVLVLDVSGSMNGQPIEETRKATSKFIETAMKEDASVGIVTYNYTADILADFSTDEYYLKEIADRLRAGGGTNIEDGLVKAREMLADSNARKKIIVLMSDGEPNNGKVGEDLISYANEIKQEGTLIYTLGFFGSLGMGKSSAQYLMEKIASDACHYEVASADDLKFFFGDIADQINGTNFIYIRIACPVDVSVSYGGEKLASSGEDANTRTSFGSLTFEESEEQNENSTDNRVKILRLREGIDYDIKIRGNGTGKMDYTIGFMDENGDYSDLREFSNVKIKKKTKIDTVATVADKTVMKVDTDGDGEYDITYEAPKNGKGKKVDNSYIYRIIYISICALAGIILLIVILIFIKKYKKRPKTESASKPVKDTEKKELKKKYCLHCGSAMPEDKKFCTNCGKPLS